MLEALLEDMRGRFTDLVQFTGPWGPIALSLASLLLVIGRKYRFISWSGVVLRLAFAFVAFTLRELYLGRL